MSASLERQFVESIQRREGALEDQGFDAYAQGMRALLAEMLPRARARSVKAEMQRRILEKIFLIACTTAQPFAVIDSLLLELEDVGFLSVERRVNVMGLLSSWLRSATDLEAMTRSEDFIEQTASQMKGLRKSRLKSEFENSVDLARARLGAFRARSGG